jgi:hypothetical protein
LLINFFWLYILPFSIIIFLFFFFLVWLF